MDIDERAEFERKLHRADAEKTMAQERAGKLLQAIRNALALIPLSVPENKDLSANCVDARRTLETALKPQ